MTSEVDVKALFDELAQMYDERQRLMEKKQEEVEAVLAPVKDELEAIEADYAVFAEDLAGAIERQELALKSWVLTHQATVKNGRLMAVYSPGRVTWDAKALEGYAAAHPELLPFRRVGQPSVSIRLMEKGS